MTEEAHRGLALVPIVRLEQLRSRGEGDFPESADLRIATYEAEIASLGNPFFDRQLHQLRATLALAKGDYDEAIAELTQANQQDTYNLCRIALAHRGKGDASGAKTWLEKTTTFNALNP